MKQTWRKILLVFVLAFAVLAPTSAVFATGGKPDVVKTTDGFYIDKTKGSISGYEGTAVDLVIPETLEGVKVVRIEGPGAAGPGMGVFEGKGLKSVTLPKNLKEIGAEAFQNNEITEINGGENLEKIERGAFQNNKIAKVELSNTITEIGREAFDNNPLASIKLSTGLETLGEKAFFSSSNIAQKIDIPSSIKYITYLEGTEKTEAATKTNTNEFFRQLYRRSVFPGAATLSLLDPYTIDSNGIITAYHGSEEKLEIPSKVNGITVTGIGDGAFKEKKITQIEIPDTVTSIGKEAFAINRLESVKLSKNLVSIGEKAFAPANPKDETNPVFTVTIPLSLTEVKYSTTTQNVTKKVNEETVAKALADHEVFPSKTKFIVERTFEFDANAQTIKGYNAKSTEVKIPEKIDGVIVKIIGAKALKEKAITKLTFESGVVEIGDNAFEGNRIESVEIPASVVMIGKSAFQDNPLKTIKLNNTLTTIGELAFAPADPAKDAENVVEVIVPRTLAKITHKDGDKAVNVSTMLDELANYNVFAKNAKVKVADGVKSAKRISGIDRYASAVEVSKEVYTTSDTVILASGETFPDALTASYLADYEEAPILLTRKAAVPKVVLDELERLETKNVIIVGGEATISRDVIDELDDYGVLRIAGDDRTLTSIEIAKHVMKESEKTVLTHVFVTDGRNFPDSLTTGVYAMQEKMPILLVGTTLDKATTDFLKEVKATNAVVVGGVNSVSLDISKGLEASVFVNRIQGPDRYETAVRMAERYAGTPTTAVITSGENYPDALVAATLANEEGAPLLLTRKAEMSNTVTNYLKSKGILKGIVIGGPSSVEDKVLDFFK